MTVPVLVIILISSLMGVIGALLLKRDEKRIEATTNEMLDTINSIRNKTDWYDCFDKVIKFNNKYQTMISIEQMNKIKKALYDKQAEAFSIKSKDSNTHSELSET